MPLHMQRLSFTRARNPLEAWSRTRSFTFFDPVKSLQKPLTLTALTNLLQPLGPRFAWQSSWLYLHIAHFPRGFLAGNY